MTYAWGAALVFLAGILWSAQGLFIRVIEDAGSWTVLFWRSVGLVPVLAIWLLISTRGRLWSELVAAGRYGLIGGVGLVGAYSGAIYSIQATSVADAVLLFSASPLFAALLGWLFLHEKVQSQTWVAIALALMGVSVMVGGGLSVGGKGLGMAAALISALGFAAFTVTCRAGHLVNNLPAVLISGFLSIAAGAMMAGVTGQGLAASPHDIAFATSAGAVTLAFGLILYTLGSRAVPAAQATLISLIEVLLGPVWAFLFLQEAISFSTMIGGGILLGAVVINVLGNRRQAA